MQIIKFMDQIFLEKLTVTQLVENSRLLSSLRIVMFSKHCHLLLSCSI
jgi:hypothetical protein